MWDEELFLDYLDGPKVVTRVLVRGVGGVRVRKEEMIIEAKKWERCSCELKKVASRNWKGQGTGFSLEASRRNQPGDILILAQ